MKIDGIYNIREHKGKTFTDIVYEWEVDLSKALDVPILRWSARHDIASRIIRRIPAMQKLKDILFGKDKHYLRFVMNALEDTPLFNHKSCIPVIIDYFVADENVNDFIRIYDKCEYVFISSRQVYDRLSEMHLPFKIVHFPLTLSRRYLSEPNVKHQKKYALTLLGTQIYDAKLRRYIEKYCETHPDFVYVRKEDKGEKYITNGGESVCDAKSRDEYFKLIRASKTTIYSTPGVRGRLSTHGYDPVTPKFLEMIASQCQVILRYSDNSDAAYFGLYDFSDNIDSYDAFERQLDKCLNSDFDAARGYEYMQRHTTDSLIPILQSI